jgi:hypothetical protein
MTRVRSARDRNPTNNIDRHASPLEAAEAAPAEPHRHRHRPAHLLRHDQPQQQDGVGLVHDERRGRAAVADEFEEHGGG